MLALPAEVFGQRGGFGRGGGFSNPAITSEELATYADMLSLDDAQREGALMLHEGYLAEFQELASEARTLIDGARQEAERSRDWSVMGELQGVLTETREKQADLAETFFEDYKLLLTPAQEATWPKVERQRRRDRTLNGGPVGNFTIYSGESVDLIKVVNTSDELSADAKTLAAPILDEYELELDRALLERNKYYEDNYSEGMRLFGERDMEKLEDMFNKAKKFSARLRDINNRYHDRIGAVLPDEDRSVLTHQVEKAMYPRVFRPTYLTNVLESTANIEGLTSEQQEQIDSITARYDTEASRLNDRWMDAIKKKEQDVSIESMMPWRRGRGGEDPERDAARERREFDDKMLDEVRAVLTEEQQAMLPEPPARERFQEFRERGRRGGDRGGDRGGRDGGRA
jgi:hypothetical protein